MVCDAINLYLERNEKIEKQARKRNMKMMFKKKTALKKREKENRNDTKT